MKRLILIYALVFLIPAAAMAQGTGFNFQGRLNDGTNPANGRYDLQFRLYNSVTGGAQIGAEVSRPNTILINGVFSTTLDFGAAAFNDPNNVFIEFSIRPAGSPNAYTILGPRQQLMAVPFAVRAATAANADNATNTLQLGGIAASEYVTTTSIENAFIKNNTTQQPTSNFNISGNGIVAGTLGIGTTPSAGIKLDVNGSTLIRTSGSGGNILFHTPNAETGMTITAGTLGRADIRYDGQTLRLFNGPALQLPSGGIAINQVGDVAVSGNITQDRDSNGLAKAVIAVNAQGGILDCYNGITNTSGAACQISIAHTLPGIYTISFNFRVNDRYVAVTPQSNSLSFSSHASFVFTGTFLIEVNTSLTGMGQAAQPSFLSDSAFMIIIY